MRIILQLLFLILCEVSIFGCSLDAESTVSEGRIESDVVDQLFELAADLMCGAEPMGDAGYAYLAGQGVKVILSVDSVKPNAELAGKYGMKTLHVPVGYDGISLGEQSRLIYYYKMAEGKVFVHCHHGTQRGPTAGAVMMMGVGAFNKEEALGWLVRAGTDRIRYEGLYETVEGFEAGATDNKPSVEAFEVDFTASAMGKIGRRFDGVKKGVAEGALLTEKVRSDAVLLLEHFKELRRVELQGGERSVDYMKRMRGMEKDIGLVYEGLGLKKVGDKMDGELMRRMVVMKKSCVSCHRVYRD